MVLRTHDGGPVELRRRAPWISLAASALVAAGCSAGPSGPTAVHRRSPASTGFTTTTASPERVDSPPTTTPAAVPTTVEVPVRQAPGWSTFTTTLPPVGGFTSVSCLSDTFCIAVGGGTDGTTSLTTGPGTAVSWDGASWSEPSVYFPAPATGPVTAPILPAVSCTDGPTCVIADGSGHVSDGNGTDWSAPMAVPAPTPASGSASGGSGPPPSAAVSCPTPTFCAVVDSTGRAYTLSDGVWGLPWPGGSNAPHSPAGPVGISCPGPSDCTAVVGPSILDWNGVGWSDDPQPWTTSPAVGPTAVSCPTPSLCAVVNGTTVAMRITGGPWSADPTVDPAGGLDSISCPSTSFCMASDRSGGVVTWNGTAWTPRDQVVPAATVYPGLATTVSCPVPTFCMVMNSDGDFATFSGTSLP